MSAKKRKHHDFGEALGEFDEVFVRNAFVHIERMNETGFWIGVDPPKSSGLPRIMLTTGVYKGEWFFNLEEDSLGGKSLSVRRPRRQKK